MQTSASRRRQQPAARLGAAVRGAPACVIRQRGEPAGAGAGHGQRCISAAIQLFRPARKQLLAASAGERHEQAEILILARMTDACGRQRRRRLIASGDGDRRCPSAATVAGSSESCLASATRHALRGSAVADEARAARSAGGRGATSLQGRAVPASAGSQPQPIRNPQARPCARGFAQTASPTRMCPLRRWVVEATRILKRRCAGLQGPE